MVRTGFVMAAALSLLVSGAAAQQAKPAPAKPPAAPAPTAPVGADPVSTSASYGDWVLRCQRVGEGDRAQRLCEVAQTIKVQNRPDPIAELAFGHLPYDRVLHLTVVLPPSVAFPSTVEVASGDKPPATADLQWRRCLPGGCFAEATAADDTMKTWRGATEPGRIAFKDASGRVVGLPFSFRGLAQALDALDKP